MIATATITDAGGKRAEIADKLEISLRSYVRIMAEVRAAVEWQPSGVS